MCEEIRRVKRELMYKGTVLEVYKDSMEFANGNHEEWDFIKHNGAAAVVPVLESQFRNALDRKTLEIPAGKLDDPEEKGILCAARELEEETGYKSEQLEWLINIRTTVALCNEKIEVYVARKLKAGTQNLDENEYVNVKAYTVDELKEKIFSGEMEDSKTIASVLAYEARYLK